MIVIYDFDKTLEQPEDQHYIAVAGKSYPLNVQALEGFFQEIIGEYHAFAIFEQKMREEPGGLAMVGSKLREMVEGLPVNPYPDVEDEEFTLGLLRFLFSLNQRTVKRGIAEAMLTKEGGH
jgi:hypothetical protein